MQGFWNFFYYFGWPLAILAMLFSLGASAWTRATFNKYSKVGSGSGITGHEAAERILHSRRLSGKFGYGHTVSVERISGNLTDNYSPKEKILRLSQGVYDSNSVAAIGVAAHECGHAIQDAENFFPNKIRAFLVPVANIGSQFGPYMAIIGVILSYQMPKTGFGDILFNVGILLFFVAVLFYLVTLPVEIDASRRAIAILREDGILSEQELAGAKKVLTAAAMTYIAAAAAAVITLLRLIGMRKRN